MGFYPFGASASAVQPWQFQPETYGAKGDGKIGTGGNGSSGSATFTDSGASFTSADVGKVIIINQGPSGTAGTGANAPFCGKINGVGSATSITLSGNLTANTVSNGAPYIYGTDDAAAIAACVTAAGTYATANNYHAQVIFKPHFYMLAALTQTTSPYRYNTHVPIPVGPQLGQKLVIDLIGVGGSMDAGIPAYWEEQIPALHGTCLVSAVSTASQPDGTYGQQSVVGMTNSVTGLSPGNFANTSLVINGITIVAPWNSEQYGVDGTLLSALNVMDGAYMGFAPVNFANNTAIGGPNYANSTVVQNAVSTGFYYPTNNNNEGNNAGLIYCAGAAIGVFFTEHFQADKLTLTYCDHCMQIDGLANAGNGQHGAAIRLASCNDSNWALWNNTSSTSGPFAMTIQLLDMENIHTGHINDPNNNLGGVINWANPSATHPVVNGGSQLSVINQNLSPGAWSGAPAVPANGTAQQNLAYRNASVYLTSGGAAVTAITVDSTVTGLTLGTSGTVMVRVPSGHSITLTYASTAPTWKWILDLWLSR